MQLLCRVRHPTTQFNFPKYDRRQNWQLRNVGVSQLSQKDNKPLFRNFCIDLKIIQNYTCYEIVVEYGVVYPQRSKIDFFLERTVFCHRKSYNNSEWALRTLYAKLWTSGELVQRALEHNITAENGANDKSMGEPDKCKGKELVKKRVFSLNQRSKSCIFRTYTSIGGTWKGVRLTVMMV